MLRVEQDKHLCRAYIEGDMNIYNAAALKEALLNIIDEPGELEINLAGVTEIDSSGIQLLMLLRKERTAHDRTLTLTDHSPSILDIFELMALTRYFHDPVPLPDETGVGETGDDHDV